MSDATLYLYTSLTAGSSHIYTATSRIETILKANRLPYRMIDLATDEAARKLWSLWSQGRKLPGLVKYGEIVGDLEQIEEFNEFGELRKVINSVEEICPMPATSYPLPIDATPKQKKPKSSKTKVTPPAKTEKTTDEEKDATAVLALRTASAEAASKAKSKSEDKEKSKAKAKTDEPKPEPEPARKHRGSVAAELPDTEIDSPKSVKRPALVPEFAAVSTANFRVDNAEALGLVQHHHSSIISISDKEENDKVVHEIRASISEDPAASEAVENIRKEAAEKGHIDAIDVTEAEKEKSETEPAEEAEESTPVVEKTAVLEEIPAESKPVVDDPAIDPVAEEPVEAQSVVEEAAAGSEPTQDTAEIKSAVATTTEEVAEK